MSWARTDGVWLSVPFIPPRGLFPRKLNLDSSSNKLRHIDGVMARAAEGALYWLVISEDLPDMLETRVRTRARHLEYMRSGGGGLVEVLIGSPTCEDADGAMMKGTWFIVEAPSRGAVEDFVASDPYEQAGIFRSTEIRALAPSFDSSRIR